MKLLDFEIFRIILSCAAIHGPPNWSDIFRNVLSQVDSQPFFGSQNILDPDQLVLVGGSSSP